MDFQLDTATGVYFNNSGCYAQHFHKGEGLFIGENYTFDPTAFGFSKSNKDLGIAYLKPVLLVEGPRELGGFIKDNLSMNQVLEIVRKSGPFWRESSVVLDCIQGFSGDHIQWGHYGFKVGFIHPADKMIVIPRQEDSTMGVIKEAQFISLEHMTKVLREKNFNQFA